MGGAPLLIGGSQPLGQPAVIAGPQDRVDHHTDGEVQSGQQSEHGTANNEEGEY